MTAAYSKDLAPRRLHLGVVSLKDLFNDLKMGLMEDV